MSESSGPRVSVIIPVYNSMPYLTGALESVLRQDLADIEVIAIDDGSTDGSGEELDRFAALDPRVTVVHQRNSGWPGSPRNRGLERARGEYVFFMDGDDAMAPVALRRMVEMAQSRSADLVIPRLAGAHGRRVQSLFATHPEGKISLSRALETLSPQKLFLRSLIEGDGVRVTALRFPEGEVRLEDGIFVTRAYLRARRIVFCGREPLYAIAERDDGQNISKRPIDPERYVASCRTIAEDLLVGVEDRARAERLVAQFFQRKGLRFYAPHRWESMDDAQRRQWVILHRGFLADLVPAELDAALVKPADVRKMRLIRAGDAEGISDRIADESRLDHASRWVSAEAVPGGIAIVVAITGIGDESLLAVPGGPRAGCLRAADAAHRLTRPGLRWRAGRGLSRRIESVLGGRAVRAQLYLSGRRVGRGVLVPGRPTAVPDAPAGGDGPWLAYRFVLPTALLRRFAGDRADLWTVAEVGRERSGRPVRVGGSGPAGAPDVVVDGVRLFDTRAGNLSLDLRASAAGSPLATRRP